MGRFWNLQTKFVGVLVLILLGSFTVQKYVQAINEERLLDEVIVISRDFADLVSRQVEQLDLPLRASQAASAVPPASPRVERVTREARLAIVARGKVVGQIRLRKSVPASRLPAPSPEQRQAFEKFRNMDVDQLNAADLLREGLVFDSPTGLRFVDAEPPDAPAEAEIDIEPYLDRIRHNFATHRRHELLATLGVFLMGIGCAWFLGVRMMRPVYEVVDGIRAVSAGQLDVQVPAQGGSEIALLGSHFNRMVERLRESRDMERKLEQRERLQLMGDLAAGVAHDVRNPLNAIHLNIGQIRDEFQPEDGVSRERFLRFTSDVQREVVRLNQLVTNFLSLARPSTEERAPVDPNDVLNDLAGLLRKEAAERGVEIVSDLGLELPHLSWNRHEIMSAFLNVAVNAFQAMEPRGGTLRLASRTVDAAGAAARPGGAPSVAIEFADTGMGISPENLEKVFIPYFTTRAGGTGLGMAIARRVAERNGGRIELDSRVGAGTTVRFLFPVLSGEEAAA